MKKEDAEIADVEFDTNTVLFAVFDGHGGKRGLNSRKRSIHLY